MMDIKFEMEDEHHVRIMMCNDKGDYHQVGRIFSPAGSGSDVVNAIQVCGFTEAYDLWGCGMFRTLQLNHGVTFKQDKYGNKLYEQVKDIQLLFSFETEQNSVQDLKLDGGACWSCFNTPCTCEIKIKHESPYAVKHHADLLLLRKPEEKKEC